MAPSFEADRPNLLFAVCQFLSIILGASTPKSDKMN